MCGGSVRGCFAGGGSAVARRRRAVDPREQGADVVVGTFPGDPHDPAGTVAAVQAALDLVTTFGKAQRHDKTLLDALIPFVESLQQSVGEGRSFAEAWSSAAEVATTEAQATA